MKFNRTYAVIVGALLWAPSLSVAQYGAKARPAPVATGGQDAVAAFWKSPSPRRLVDLGRATRGASMRPYQHLNDGDTANVPRNAQFDAAKKRMNAGAVLPVGPANWRGAPLQASAMTHAAHIAPKPITPSFFRSQADVRLATESSPDDAAALVGARVSMTFADKPVAWAPKHDGPAVVGLTGFGDVGFANLHFMPPLTIFAVQRNGLIAASSLRTTENYGEGGPEYCSEENYSFAGLNGKDYGKVLTFGDQPVKGYSELVPGSNPYVMFVTTRTLPARKVQVATRSAKIPSMDGTPGATNPVALHEVDLDGDGVADILVWETTRMGAISEGPVFDRSYYVNIAGRWYHAGHFEQSECT